jgi:hypothetical protein
MDGYLVKGGQLKFITLKNANEQFNLQFKSVILNRLSLPWYKKIYDLGNILGRAIGFTGWHIPGTYDCSEVSLWALKQCAMYLPIADSNIIMAIPNTASPADLDAIVQANPNVFSVYGEWSADDGVTVS